MKHRLFALSQTAPAGFEHRTALTRRDLREGVFALFADSLEAAELALKPFGNKLAGLVITCGEAAQWQPLACGVYHLKVPCAWCPDLVTVAHSHLELLAKILTLSDSHKEQLYGLNRAREDRGRLVSEFSGLRESLLNEISERRAAQAGLQQARDELEVRVGQRTAELAQANRALQAEIGDRKRAEEALQHTAVELVRSNAELEQFAYVASHDLQEPLRTVASFVQLLESHYKGQLDARADKFISFAVSGAVRMQRLIRDLLAFARVDNRPESLAALDCEEIVEQARTNLSQTLELHGASLTTARLPVIQGVPEQILRVFQNLIANGIKFHGQAAPHVHVSAADCGEEWKLSVADNGIGIEPQYYSRIFLIFQRLHSRESYEGTGIGLAICKKIVERHGGRIWVEPAPPQGSVFHFTIPKKPIL